MARLRFVGRPGRRFGNKGLQFASKDHDRDPKTQLLINVHRGLRDFIAIAGDSDEEDFPGFTEDDIQKIVTKTSDLLTIIRSDEGTASTVEEIGGRLRQRTTRTTAKPFIQLTKSRYSRNAFLTSTPAITSDKQHVRDLPTVPTSSEVITPKPMRGTIKVRLFGKGFLFRRNENKGTSSRERKESGETKSPRKSGHVRTKKVARGTNKNLLKGRDRRVIKLKRGGRRPKDDDDIKYCLGDPKPEKVKEKTEESPSKRGLSLKTSHSSPRSVKIRRGMLGFRKRVKRPYRRLKKEKEEEEEADGDEWEKSFQLPAESSHSQRKITANKRFLEEASEASESTAKRPKLGEAKSVRVRRPYVPRGLRTKRRTPREVVDLPSLISDLPLESNEAGEQIVTKKVPMFDAPLICESKRQHKPAQKLIMKWSEDYDLNKKKSRKLQDAFVAGIELSEDEVEDDFRVPHKSTRLPRMRRHQKILQRAKRFLSQSLSLKSNKVEEDTPEDAAGNFSFPMVSNTTTILSQKNSNLGRTPDETVALKKSRKIKKCCVCDGCYRLSHHMGCQSMCCRSCARFFRSKASLFLKDKLDLVCTSSEGDCVISWKTLKDDCCSACRYKKCLQFFPSPEKVVNFKSERKCDIAKRDRRNSRVILTPPKSASPWTAEMIKFLNATSQNTEEVYSDVMDDSVNSGSVTDLSFGSPSSVVQDTKKSRSRRLCKLGKGRSPKSLHISEILTNKHQQNIETPASDGAGNRQKVETVLEFDKWTDPLKLLSEEAVRTKADGSGYDALKSEVKPTGFLAAEGETPAALSFCASPKLLNDVPQVMERFGQKLQEMEEGIEGAESDTSERKGESKGPRIKHVCRKAAVVLGKQPATFPPRPELCLSALPSQEKERILQHDENSRGSSDVVDASVASKDKGNDMGDVESSPKKVVGKGMARKPPKRSGGPKKTLRCKKCIGCLTPECGVCAACRDMPKNGGRGTMKHACIHRVCKNPILPWHKLTPEKLAKAKLEKELEVQKKEKLTVAKKISKSRLQVTSGFTRPRGRPKMSLIGNKKYPSRLSTVAGQSHTTSSTDLFKLSKSSGGVDDKAEKNQILSNKTKSLSEQQPQNTIKVDYNENVDIEIAWNRGMALISLVPSCLRAACCLCGSAGQQEMVYCSVCCEPFHSFCLEEKDRPKEGCDTWCCLQCQFCHVCYGQSNLLQCDKCQESYHPECRGPNYPTKPSRRKRIWVCSKCVKCRSCGATTPGQDKEATWMFDFSLCYSCGLLMEKGNFCPVCHKCYMDDDWESQMIQCCTCHSWVHSKCEELTDEMYQIVTYMPEDVPFNCRVCCPNRPSVWRVLIEEEMQNGMRRILDTLVHCEASLRLEPIKNTTLKVENSTALCIYNSSGDLRSHTMLSESPHSLSLSAEQSEPRALGFEQPSKDEHTASSEESEALGTENATSESSMVSSGVTNLPNTVKSDIVESDRTIPVSELPRHLSDSQVSSSPPFSDNPVPPALESTLPASNSIKGPSSANPTMDSKLRSLLQGFPCLGGSTAEPHKDVPQDFSAIQAKLEKENGYGSIEEFAGDIARIIHYNMELNDDNSSSVRAKAGASVRAVFVRHMEKCFPWFNVKNSRCWSNASQTARNGILDQAVMPPSRDHTYAHWLEKEAVPNPVQPSLFRYTGRDRTLHFGYTMPEQDKVKTNGEAIDVRCCALCWTFGDADEDEAGRLVSAGQDDWVHVNCALWSAEVYEEVDGTLQMVHAALARSKKLRCDMCGKPGATVGCCQQGCNANFHFVCARRKNCAFLETKKVFCELHWMAVDAELIADGNFAVNRRICISPSGNRWTKRQWWAGVDPAGVNILIGSLLVESLGHLSSLSDTKAALLPVGFCMSRLFWSTEDPRQRSVYCCRVIEVIPKPKAPEVIDDITVIHDENDPRYDAELAMSFTYQAQDPMSDESTLSASEDPDRDLSDSDIEALTRESSENVKHTNSNEFDVSTKFYKSERGLETIEQRKSDSFSGWNNLDRPRISLSSSYPERKNTEQWLKTLPQPRLSQSFSGDVQEKPSQASSSYGRLSATTLKMLGVRNRANEIGTKLTESQSNNDEDDDQLTLVKIATRLNEAAAKNRIQEFQKRFRDENGTDTASNSTDEDASNSKMMSLTSTEQAAVSQISEFSNNAVGTVLPTRNLTEEGLVLNRLGKTDGVSAKTMKPFVQMDGPAGESDVDNTDEDDLELVADFSSESDDNLGTEDLGNGTTGFNKSSLSSRSSTPPSRANEVAKESVVDCNGENREECGGSSSGENCVDVEKLSAASDGETVKGTSADSDTSGPLNSQEVSVNSSPSGVEYSGKTVSESTGTVSDSASVCPVVSCVPSAPMSTETVSDSARTVSEGSKTVSESAGKVSESASGCPNVSSCLLSAPMSAGTVSDSGRTVSESFGIVSESAVTVSGSVMTVSGSASVCPIVSPCLPSTPLSTTVEASKTTAIVISNGQSQTSAAASQNTQTTNIGPLSALMQSFVSKQNAVQCATNLSVGIGTPVHGLQQVPDILQVAAKTCPRGTPPQMMLQSPPTANPIPTIPHHQVHFVNQLMQTNNVSYLGSVALTPPHPTHIRQVVESLHHPQTNAAASALFAQPVQTASVPFNVPAPQVTPQIQVATSSSGITPQILKSLQEMFGASTNPQPVFFKLTNTNVVNQSPTITCLNPSPINANTLNISTLNAAPNSPWTPTFGSPLTTQFPIQNVNEFGRNIVNAVPLYAGGPVQSDGHLGHLVIPGQKHPLDDRDELPSKRFKPGGNERTDQQTSFKNGSDQHVFNKSGSRYQDSREYKQSPSQSGNLPRSRITLKKSQIKSTQDSNIDLDDGPSSRVLTETNRSEEDMELNSTGSRKAQHKLAVTKTSKHEPTFEPHPMFRPHLPEAELEEEIENSPLLAMLETEEQRIKDEAQLKKNAPHLMFEITSDDGFHVQADSLNKAWKAVTDRVQDARLSAGMKPVSFIGMNGIYMTGLNHPAVVYLVEQLPGIRRFHNYEMKFHPGRICEDDDEIIENPHGCCRAEPFAGRNKYEMFSFLLSRYRIRPEYDPNAAHEENIMANKSQRRCTSLDLPMAMRFRHLRTFAKEAVGVYRSNIHGRGLFCKRDIDAGEMIIEYSGEVIRAILTDKREKHYESKAMGCYMFRKDRDHVIDSTMMGNAARFINHSCDPNCYSKVILVDNRKHIVIFAMRAIKRGEELTYDYKFPIEDVKIPCTCGSRRCRKYLN